MKSNKNYIHTRYATQADPGRIEHLDLDMGSPCFPPCGQKKKCLLKKYRMYMWTRIGRIFTPCSRMDHFPFLRKKKKTRDRTEIEARETPFPCTWDQFTPKLSVCACDEHFLGIRSGVHASSRVYISTNSSPVHADCRLYSQIWLPVTNYRLHICKRIWTCTRG